MLERLIQPLLRRLHARGHGVHSPLAYRLVRDVLYLPHSYALYAYHEIDLACSGMPGRHSIYPRACRLARIAAFLNPHSVYISSGSDRIAWQVIDLVASKARKLNGDRIAEADMCLITSEKEVAGFLNNGRRPGSNVARIQAVLTFGINAESAGRIFEAAPGGILFQGKKTCMMFISSDIQKVTYTLPF